MTKEEKEIERLLESAQSYFGKDEKIYIFKCKNAINWILSLVLLLMNIWDF